MKLPIKTTHLIGALLTVTIGGTIAGTQLWDNNDEEELSQIELSDNAELKYVKQYEECDTIEIYEDGDAPELFREMDFTGFSKQELAKFLPDDWNIESFSENEATLTYEGDICPEHRDESDVVEASNEDEEDFVGYIGLYHDNIAIYKGQPPDGELIEITRFEVKEVYRHELEQGIAFESQGEKEQILENYTS